MTWPFVRRSTFDETVKQLFKARNKISSLLFENAELTRQNANLKNDLNSLLPTVTKVSDTLDLRELGVRTVKIAIAPITMRYTEGFQDTKSSDLYHHMSKRLADQIVREWIVLLRNS